MPEPRALRTAAVAGLGAAARRIHLPALAAAGFGVVGGCDPAVADGAFGFPVFADAERLLEAVRPDLLVVAAPPEAHHALAALGLDAGAHVLCEKPFVPTLAEADDLCARARRAGRLVAVNNQYRFMAIHRAAKARIGTPEFGDLLFVSAEQTFFRTAATEAGWRGAQRERTWREFGTHVVDLCRYFFGQEPLAVTARLPRPDGPGAPDHLVLVQLEFPGDRVAQVTLDRLSRGRHRYLEMRLDGTAGCIETRIGGGFEIAAGVRGGTRRPFVRVDAALGGRARLHHGEAYRTIATEPLDPFAAATARLLEALRAAVAAGTPPPCGAEDNRRTLAVMLAAYESDRRRAPVALEP
jgi:predicted dehydrogenase